MNKTKVIILSALDIWSMGNGNGAPSFYNTIKLYLDKGHEVVLIKPTGKKHYKDTILGLKIITFSHDFFDALCSIPKISFFGRIISAHDITSKMYLLAKKEIKNTNGPCMLYAYEVHAVKAAKMLSEKYKLPLVTRFQGTVLHNIPATWLNRLKRYPHYHALSTKSDLVIMTNDGTFGDVVLNELNNKSGNILFWRNGVSFSAPDDETKLTALKQKYKIRASDFVLMTLCRLAGWKRIDRAIEAVNALVKSYPNIKLLIVGDGDKKTYLQTMVNDYKLTDNVEFVGSVEQTDSWKYYQLADVFLSLYDLSNLGNPLFEAMHFRKPIITVDTGNTRSVITDGFNGIIVTPDDNEALCKAIKKLMRDNEYREYIANNAKQYADKNFLTWNERMENEYKEVTEMVRQHDLL